MNLPTIHPFPARMAPEIALNALCDRRPGSIVLDPMSGSGTTLRMASENGLTSKGFDLDPLAILISQVWNTPVLYSKVEYLGQQLLETSQYETNAILPWVDDETDKFLKFWFAEPQRNILTRIASVLQKWNEPEADVLRVALSRLIITKKRGASLAWDVSHGKPHKVRFENDFDIWSEFPKAVKAVCRNLPTSSALGTVIVERGDARRLNIVEDNSIDFILTSPPYLHAVDYMRGHRLSLVWLGWSLNELRKIRSKTIGVEIQNNGEGKSELIGLLHNVATPESLLVKQWKTLERYGLDLWAVCEEMYRTLKPNGEAMVVIADSYVRGNLVRNTQLFKNAARIAGLQLISEHERQILASRRYLPPPSLANGNDLSKRMKTEAYPIPTTLNRIHDLYQ